ncbi:MAG: SRPBCC family protein [Bacteroidota bacterium]
MKVYTQTTQQLIHAPIEKVWDFFSDAQNLGAITPAYMNFRTLTENLPKEIYPGLIITYKVAPLLHVPMFWMTEITSVIKHKLFVDEQRSGPYKLWHHQHHFEKNTDGVLMTDILHYSLPFYFLGTIAHTLFVKKQLRNIFDYRYQRIEELFHSK